MEDLISRQAAIDEIRKCRFVVDAIEKIRGLPSAEPKTGEWIENDSDTWVCSECGVENAYAVYRGRICDNYCPHCGADMRGEQDANND